jgi:protein TonB
MQPAASTDTAPSPASLPANNAVPPGETGGYTLARSRRRFLSALALALALHAVFALIALADKAPAGKSNALPVELHATRAAPAQPAPVQASAASPASRAPPGDAPAQMPPAAMPAGTVAEPAPAPAALLTANAQANTPPVFVEASVDADHLERSPPEYPEQSRRRGEEGTVILRVDVSAGGEPVTIGVEHSSGSARLDEAAARAVRSWRFAPARRDGRAEASSVLVPVTFSHPGN